MSGKSRICAQFIGHYADEFVRPQGKRQIVPQFIFEDTEICVLSNFGINATGSYFHDVNSYYIIIII